MSGSGVGSNTGEAAAAARIGQRVSDALDGISRRFETTADNLDSASLEAKINGAFSDYYIDHKQAVQTVESNGRTISRNAEAAAERISGTDHESEGGFTPMDLSPLRPSDVPVGVYSPEYLRQMGVQDYDTNHLLREVNRGGDNPGRVHGPYLP